jgi:aminoglycoside phosphotransferase (APT) family kinase protein
MHDDEIDIDEPLVRALLREQFPAWADLPLQPVEPAGTDNAIYRLGDEMSVRLPRIAWARDQPSKEHTWIPRIAPHLSLGLPEPLGRGEPGEGYPWNWSVCTWVAGEPASPDRLGDGVQVAEELARLLVDLQSIDASSGPPPDGRGGPLAPRDEACRDAIAKLGDAIERPVRWPSGRRRSMPRPGPGRRSGSTATSMHATSWRRAGASAACSTSPRSPSATPRPT